MTVIRRRAHSRAPRPVHTSAATRPAVTAAARAPKCTYRPLVDTPTAADPTSQFDGSTPRLSSSATTPSRRRGRTGAPTAAKMSFPPSDRLRLTASESKEQAQAVVERASARRRCTLFSLRAPQAARCMGEPRADTRRRCWCDPSLTLCLPSVAVEEGRVVSRHRDGRDDALCWAVDDRHLDSPS